MNIDATFTAYTILVAEHLPFNPATAEATRATFLKRASLTSWEQLQVRGEPRAQLLGAFEAALAPLAALLSADASGPFFSGARATYADIIVGGWLNMFAQTMPEEEWKAVRRWHGGAFAALHDALQADYFVCD